MFETFGLVEWLVFGAIVVAVILFIHYLIIKTAVKEANEEMVKEIQKLNETLKGQSGDKTIEKSS